MAPSVTISAVDVIAALNDPLVSQIQVNNQNPKIVANPGTSDTWTVTFGSITVTSYKSSGQTETTEWTLQGYFDGNTFDSKPTFTGPHEGVKQPYIKLSNGRVNASFVKQS